MSFGYSVGDAVLLIQLAWKTLQNTRKACGEHDELTREVSSLHRVLKRLQRELENPESLLNRTGDDRKEELREIGEGCSAIMNVMNSILNKYNALPEEKRSGRKLWQKIRFGNGEMQDLSEIRLKLSTHTSAILMMVNLCSLGSQGRVETQLNSVGGELEGIRGKVDWIAANMSARSGEGTVWTSYANDDKTLWKELRSELNKEGYDSSVLHKHKRLIKKYVQELGDRGLFDQAEDEDANYAEEEVDEEKAQSEEKNDFASDESEKDDNRDVENLSNDGDRQPSDVTLDTAMEVAAEERQPDDSSVEMDAKPVGNSSPDPDFSTSNGSPLEPQSAMYTKHNQTPKPVQIEDVPDEYFLPNKPAKVVSPNGDQTIQAAETSIHNPHAKENEYNAEKRFVLLPHIDKVDIIKFKDAVGRKYALPFQKIKTWTRMEDCIKSIFSKIDALSPSVEKGHYDLIGPNGDFILPQHWEELIQPGWSITMNMLPLPEPTKSASAPQTTSAQFAYSPLAAPFRPVGNDHEPHDSEYLKDQRRLKAGTFGPEPTKSASAPQTTSAQFAYNPLAAPFRPVGNDHEPHDSEYLKDQRRLKAGTFGRDQMAKEEGTRKHEEDLVLKWEKGDNRAAHRESKKRSTVKDSSRAIYVDDDSSNGHQGHQASRSSKRSHGLTKSAQEFFRILEQGRIQHEEAKDEAAINAQRAEAIHALQKTQTTHTSPLTSKWKDHSDYAAEYMMAIRPKVPSTVNDAGLAKPFYETEPTHITYSYSSPPHHPPPRQAMMFLLADLPLGRQGKIWRVKSLFEHQIWLRERLPTFHMRMFYMSLRDIPRS